MFDIDGSLHYLETVDEEYAMYPSWTSYVAKHLAIVERRIESLEIFAALREGKVADLVYTTVADHRARVDAIRARF